MPKARSNAKLRTVLWGGLALLVPVVIAGAWIYVHPPPPSLARTAGLAGERYGPDVLGLDADGWIRVNGQPYAAPREGRFDAGAVLEVARSRWRLRAKDADWPWDLREWQVLSIEPDVAMQEVEALLALLRGQGVPRTCFDAARVQSPERPPRLVHAWRPEERGTSCGAELGYDPTILVVLTCSEWEDEPYEWGPSGAETTEAGDLAALSLALAEPGLECAFLRARPEASWGAVLTGLCAIEDAGFEPELPIVAAEDA